MAIKGPYISRKKGAKKGARKKQVDTFAKKEWFNLRIPSVFRLQFVGNTCVTRSSTKQNLEKLLIGRTFEVNQGDTGDYSIGYRKFNFIVQDVRNRDCIATFNGMQLTSDKLRGIIKKGHTFIEADALVRTVDDYLLRVFVVAQSRRLEKNLKPKVHLQTADVREIRREMFQIIENEFKDCNIDQAMEKMCAETVGKEIESVCASIAPLQNCFTKQVLVVKRPKYERNEDVEIDSEATGHVNECVVYADEDNNWGDEQESDSG